jgi:hypothetical protein
MQTSLLLLCTQSVEMKKSIMTRQTKWGKWIEGVEGGKYSTWGRGTPEREIILISLCMMSVPRSLDVELDPKWHAFRQFRDVMPKWVFLAKCTHYKADRRGWRSKRTCFGEFPLTAGGRYSVLWQARWASRMLRIALLWWWAKFRKLNCIFINCLRAL